MEKINILGVNIDPVTVNDVLAYLLDAIRSGKRTYIANVHVMALNLAYEQPWLREFYNRAGIAYCDGMGVKLGSRLLGHPLPQRLTLADWWPELARFSQEHQLKLFLLGNPPGSAVRAGQKLCEGFPGLQIAGEQHGFFDKTPGSLENEAVLERIRLTRPDLLLVGFGVPAQEKWLKENFNRLETPVAITCGALFEYIAGDLRRGPDWLTQNYLEWLARLLISPGRYGRRYLRDNPLFIGRLLRQRLSGATQN